MPINEELLYLEMDLLPHLRHSVLKPLLATTTVTDFTDLSAYITSVP